MREISRIQKSPTGCFYKIRLSKRHKIKLLNIDLDTEIIKLISDGYITKGNKKDIYCLTHEGKLREHEIEREYNLNKNLRIERNRYKL